MRWKVSQIALERIRIGEEMRGLAKKQPRILPEIADGPLQELAHGHVVGVEDDDEFARRERQAVVHVAGLGVLVARAREVDGAQFARQGLQLQAPIARGLRLLRMLLIALLVGAAVVEHIDLEAVARIIHADRADDGHGEQFGILVVGRDEDVDGGKLVLVESGRRRALQRVGDHEQADRQHDRAVDFRDVEQNPGDEIGEVGDRGQRVDGAPEEIAQHDRRADDQEDVAPDAGQLQRADAGHQRQGDDADDKLAADADRLGGERDEPGAPQSPEGGPYPRIHQTLTLFPFVRNKR